MEDNFRVRADKVFGSLGGDTALSVGVSSSLWCLGDEEIERREWNRSKDYGEEEGDGYLESGPPLVRNPLIPDLRDLTEEEEEEEEDEDEDEDEEVDGGKKKRRRNNTTGAETSVDEYFDVQSNIGRDCTLDDEEEEDQYDKVAVGTEEQTGDRLYMRDVKVANYEIHELNEYGELPNTFQAVVRGARANHTAAKIRIKEDAAEAAGNMDTLQLSDNSAATNAEAEDPKNRELDSGNPKPILKKRENLMDSKSQKRVRFEFDPTSSTQNHEGQQALEPCDSGAYALRGQAPDLSRYSSGVPDYVRHPSKYTRYAFDSSDDMDEQSNRKAYMEFFGNMRKKNTNLMMDETSAETPESVVFTPRRKTDEGLVANRSERTGDVSGRSKRWSVSILAINQESEVSAMEEDEPCLAAVGEGSSILGKPDRQYRARIIADVDGDPI